MNAALRPLAVVTGASSGIGLELALECARNGFDLVISADRPMANAAAEIRALGASVETVETDLATPDGIAQLYASLADRPVQALLANAGHGLGKAFIDSFSWALRNELKDTAVTVTCLMPGATETDFFERADMLDTKVGAAKKDDPAEVARVGFKAMMNGDGDVVTGMKNKLQSAIATVTPSAMLAEQHRKMA